MLISPPVKYTCVPPSMASAQATRVSATVSFSRPGYDMSRSTSPAITSRSALMPSSQAAARMWSATAVRVSAGESPAAWR